MKILIYAAHPDDEAFGCSGAILKHVKDKDQVYVVFFTDGESSRKTKSKNISKKKISLRKLQSLKVSKKLGVKKTFYEEFNDNELDKVTLLTLVKTVEHYKDLIKPDVVYTHFYGDLNIDHQLISKSVITAYRPNKRANCKKILFFEILSSTNFFFNKKFFIPNYFINISDFIKKKLMICKTYKNEIKKDQGRSLKNIKNLAEYRGSQAGFDYAEAFQVHKIFY